MKKTIISIIAAVAENRAIGLNNKLLWNIPEDMQHFKKVTEGHPVIMGQNTFESIGKALPKRLNIVLTLEPNFTSPGCTICFSIGEAVQVALQHDQKEVFFIGGGSIYQQALPLADKLYLTVVKGSYEADTYFPDYSEFKRVVSRRESSDEKYQYSFLELIR